MIFGANIQTKVAEKVTKLALSAFSRIDALILNHGILSAVTRVSSSSVAEWQNLYNVNLFSAVAFVKAALPSLRVARGRIIFTSSGAATGAYSTWGAYGSSKAALNHLAMTLAVEEPKITSVSIRPGVVDTGMQKSIREEHNHSMDEKDMEKFSGLHRDGKLLKPEQPGGVIARLAVGAGLDLSGKFLRYVNEVSTVSLRLHTAPLVAGRVYSQELTLCFSAGMTPPSRNFRAIPIRALDLFIHLVKRLLRPPKMVSTSQAMEWVAGRALKPTLKPLKASGSVVTAWEDEAVRVEAGDLEMTAMEKRAVALTQTERVFTLKHKGSSHSHKGEISGTISQGQGETISHCRSIGKKSVH